ncbi:MAG: winged helix DNA-binding protein [Alphaproteobacteria bacterium]|nr:winged helix DNA-binding protein [Alphaproteobacteria bacterium]MBU0795476.1 winged helix DNA-binding protein [Alphaproteobacteria bacterium]MBU0875348.1 winged helix DNA-binding protein [Alphaproteobacteria bacterium]MBU1771278.1 winged helix DNA-binding protein [Alphaproteobacteria bacterium]
MSDAIGRTDERLAQLFSAAYEQMRERIYARARDCGFADLRPAHSSVLRHIDAEGSRVVTLAERAGMTKQSMGYLTDSLARLGYVAMSPDPSDGRAKLVRLTERGQEAVATLTRLSLEAEAELRDALGAERLAALRAAMNEVLAVLR